MRESSKFTLLYGHQESLELWLVPEEWSVKFDLILIDLIEISTRDKG